jgi:hypothetical protein
MGNIRLAVSLGSISKLFLLVLLLLVSPLCFGHKPADGMVHATLGPHGFLTDARQPGSYPMLSGIGLLAEADLYDKGGVELGIFHMRKIYVMHGPWPEFAEQVKRIHIASGYRHWFTNRFSGGILFFSAYTMGDPQSFRGTSSGDKSSAFDVTEYGFDFSVQAEPFQMGKFSIIVDTRYSYSLTPKVSERSNHYGAFVGLKYLVQEKSTAKGSK